MVAGYTEIFASETSKTGEPMVGVPGMVVPNKKTPSLKAFTTMEKRRYGTNYYAEELAATDDIFSLLTSISSACMIGQWSLSAPDPEAAEKTLAEMRLWIRETGLITAFKGGEINSDDRGALRNWFVHGKMAIFALRDGVSGSGKITKYHNLPVDGLVRMTDPKNPLNYYFYQKLKVLSDYKNPRAMDDVNTVSEEANVSSKEQTIWYILGGEGAREETGDDGQLIYPMIGEEDWVNELADLTFVRNPAPPMNDEMITTIMNKRYILRMSIVAAQLGLVPFDKLTFGSEEFPPVPAPDENIRTTNPTLWSKQNLAYSTYRTNMQNTLDSLFDAITNGKPFGTHPGITHERHEPRMALTAEFIEQLVNTYNDVIARHTGIPRSMVESLGTELATSRLTKSIVDIAMMSQQLVFNDVITYLLTKEFESAFLNDGIEVALQPLDKADQKTQCELELLVAQASETLSRAGATPATIQNYILGSEDMPIRQCEFVDKNTDYTTRVIE